jgi:hypothetical protein
MILYGGFTRLDQFVSVLAMNNMFLGCGIVLFLDNTMPGKFSTLLTTPAKLVFLHDSTCSSSEVRVRLKNNVVLSASGRLCSNRHQDCYTKTTNTIVKIKLINLSVMLRSIK